MSTDEKSNLFPLTLEDGRTIVITEQQMQIMQQFDRRFAESNNRIIKNIAEHCRVDKASVQSARIEVWSKYFDESKMAYGSAPLMFQHFVQLDAVTAILVAARKDDEDVQPEHAMQQWRFRYGK